VSADPHAVAVRLGRDHRTSSGLTEL
jgi:hypothetical protein